MTDTLDASCGERHTVRHASDADRLDYVDVVVRTPNTPRVAVNLMLQAREKRQTMHPCPLLQNALHVLRVHDRIRTAVPHGQPRPWSTVRRCRSHEFGPLLGGTAFSTRHGLEGFLHVGCR